VSLHAAFISGSCQPEGRSAVEVGKPIGAPRWFATLPFADHLFSPPPSSSSFALLFDRFQSFREVVTLVKRRINNPRVGRFDDPVYSRRGDPPARKEARRAEGRSEWLTSLGSLRATLVVSRYMPG